METFSGIRARNKDTSKAQADGYDSKCKDETVTVKLWAFLSRLFNMKQKKGSQVFMILCLSMSSPVSVGLKCWLLFRSHKHPVMVLPQQQR